MDSNKDIFFKEIMEGIQTILIGTASNFETPLVFVGGNRKHLPCNNFENQSAHFFKCFFTRVFTRL